MNKEILYKSATPMKFKNEKMLVTKTKKICRRQIEKHGI
jgi:hypothetical protein